MRILLGLGWTVAALEAILLLLSLFSRNMGDNAAGRGAAAIFGLVGLTLLIGAATILYFAGRARSWVSLIFAVALLALPLIVLFGTAATSLAQEAGYAVSGAKVGRFPEAKQRELAAAISADDFARMRAILALHPNLSGRDPIGYDLLSFAVMRVQTADGRPEAVRLLLEAGMDPNQSRSPAGVDLVNDLVFASDAKSKEVLRLLLDHHADANALHPQTGRPPLVVAEDPEVLEMLIRHGANVNWHGSFSPLIHSILTSHWDNAVYLIGLGADLSLQAADGTTAASALENVRNADGTLPAGAQKVKDAMAAAR